MTQLATQQRKVPWLGVGVSGSWGSSSEALQAADMNFYVKSEKTYWKKPALSTGNATWVDDEELPMFANVRADTNEVLGCVTPNYRIVQNTDAFSLIDPFLGNDGEITNVGMTGDGLCFMVAKVKQGLELGGDPFDIYLMATNSFNTKYPCQIIMTPIRIYCQNMYRKLVKDQVFLAKHTDTANERVKRIASTGGVDKKVLLFQEFVERSQGKALTRNKLDHLVELLFPLPKPGGPRELTFVGKAKQSRQDFIDRYFDAPDNRKYRDCAFGFINAYFDYISHRERNTAGWEGKRLSGIVSGDAVNTKLIKEAMQ